MPVVPNQLRAAVGGLRQRLRARRGRRCAVITQPAGRLDPTAGPATFLVVVGPGFNQHVPNAFMTCRMGYCQAFEQLGIPYLIVDINDLRETLDRVPNPFCMLLGYEYNHPGMDRATRCRLRQVPHCVWVNPWFKDSDRFFALHHLEASVWDWSARHRHRIFATEPRFVFTATVPRGLCFFDQWRQHGLHLVSLPLACDTSLYRPETPPRPEFENIQLAFVGGYWESKGRQIDEYLRPFENELTIYGYSRWPYRGYRGRLPRQAEPALYRQTALCPTINEPTVRLLHGQINERVFKILGSGGATVVDAVPAYRELFDPDELPVPQDAAEFAHLVRHLLHDIDERHRWAMRGRHAVLQRHTYHHRARQMLEQLRLTHLLPAAEPLRKAS